MPLPIPNLDDRDFQQLMDAALSRLRRLNPAWDDLSPGDPGIVLLELFAYLTDTLLYRANQIPAKVYVALLRLLGVSLYPPAAAVVVLRFSRARGNTQTIEIPRGTRVTVTGGAGAEPPVFATVHAATLAADAESVEVVAYHAEMVEAEVVGTASGRPGLSVQVARPPIIRPVGDERDLLVAVEVGGDTLDDRVPVIQVAGAPYRIWREVADFANLGDDRFAYVVDRITGTITFAPSVYTVDDSGEISFGDGALGEVPPVGRSLRVWYRRGGGAAGNVAAETLTVMKDPIPGLQVTNPGPAAGGRDAETLENALLRGPKELHSLDRAVTASDFELVALKTSGVARARAFTSAELWRYAQRGTVTVVLVPDVPASAWPDGRLSAEALAEHATEPVREAVQRSLDERKPLGIHTVVQPVRVKTVSVAAEIVIRREEDASAVRNRVLERLYRTINPLPSPNVNARGWPFGQTLRVSHVYDVALAEPGVRWVANVELRVPDVPLEVRSLAADYFQPGTWYAASGGRVFKTLNDGLGWEIAVAFEDGEGVDVVEAHPNSAGYVAAITHVGEGQQSRVYVSRDNGDHWENVANTEFQIEDVAWMQRDRAPVLLLASDAGLFEMTAPRPNGELTQVLVNASDQAMSFYAVATSTDIRGEVTVAVAAQNEKGVYLSAQAGRGNTFRRITGTVDGKDVRVLAVQQRGARAWLWAGTYTFGDDPGSGCYRWELRGDEDPVEGWVAMNANWKGGSCRGLAFVRSGVLAATHRGGVMFLNPDNGYPDWQTPDVNAGLPVRDLARGWFAPVDTVAANPDGTRALAGVGNGGERSEGKGVYRADDSEAAYADWRFAWVSNDRFTDRVTLPPTWLLTSGEHEITVVSEDEAR